MVSIASCYPEDMRKRRDSLLILATASYGMWTSARTSLLLRRLAPRAAAGDASAAESVTQTPYARAILGIPNSDLACAYYCTLLVLCLSGTLRKRPVLAAARVTAWGTSAFSVYLIYVLYFRLHRRCPVCMRAHANNLALTVLLQFAVVAGAAPSIRRSGARPE